MRLRVQPDRLVGRGEIGARGGDGRIGLLELGAGIEAGGDAVGDQLLRLGAHAQCILLHPALGGEPREIGIGAGDIGREDEPRLLELDPCRFGLRCRGGEGGAVLAPQIQVEAQARGDAPAVVPALLHERGGDAVVIALLGLCGARIDPDRGQPRGTGLLGKGLGRAQPGGGGGEIGRVRQALFDQCGQLRVAIIGPPIGGRPGRSRGGRGERLACGIAVARANFGPRAELRHRRAGGKQEGDGQRREKGRPETGSSHDLYTVLEGTAAQMVLASRLVNRKSYPIVRLWKF